MAVHSGPNLHMSQVNAVFGWGNNINAYRGRQWWTDAGATGNFSSGQMGMSEFRGKRPTAPISNGLVDMHHVGGGGPTWQFGLRSIGTPHPNRIVVVATMTGDTTGSPISFVRINGVASTFAAKSSGSGSMRACAIAYRHMPGPETQADFSVSNSNNASQCFIGIYAVYSPTHTHISADSGSTTATTATATGLVSHAGGVAIVVSHHRNVNATTFGGTLGGAWTTNWNADVGGGANGAVGWKTTDGSSGTATASWGGAVNGSMSCALFSHM
jgi:hypothetical protein